MVGSTINVEKRKRLAAAINEVVERHDDEWESDGDAWLCYRNPDEAFLLTGELGDAIYDAVIQELEA